MRCGGWAPGTGLGQAGNLGHGSERRLTGDWAPSESRRFSASITMNLTEGRQAKLQLTKQQSLFGRERGVAVSVQSVTQRERPCDARERTCRGGGARRSEQAQVGGGFSSSRSGGSVSALYKSGFFLVTSYFLFL